MVQETKHIHLSTDNTKQAYLACLTVHNCPAKAQTVQLAKWSHSLSKNQPSPPPPTWQKVLSGGRLLVPCQACPHWCWPETWHTSGCGVISLVGGVLRAALVGGVLGAKPIHGALGQAGR